MTPISIAILVFGILIGLLVIVRLIDLFVNRHPLDEHEVLRLAEKRRRQRALRSFEFSKARFVADPAQKKSMRGNGEFVPCDLEWRELPANIAALLKYKKHEWIVVAFVSSKKARALWWNKGPNGSQVGLFLDNQSLVRCIERLKPDTLAIFHNHPNPDPSRWRLDAPSDVDLESANACFQLTNELRVSVLEFICERGRCYMYFAGFAEDVVPLKPIVDEICEINGSSIFKNYALRTEGRAQPKAQTIASPSK